MTVKNKRLIDISLALALTVAVIISMTGFVDACSDMYENIIRIRIIANSDADEDQALKIRIRDRLLESSKEIFDGISDFNDAVVVSNHNLKHFEDVAKSEVLKSGFDYSVVAEFRDELFNTREYENFTLPAGHYKTLIITLGEGKGENWWCVIFPKVCVGSSSGKLTESIKQNSAEKAENPQKYILKFKIVEIFQRFKKFI